MWRVSDANATVGTSVQPRPSDLQPNAYPVEEAAGAVLEDGMPLDVQPEQSNPVDPIQGVESKTSATAPSSDQPEDPFNEDELFCRICHEGTSVGPLVSPCWCSGSMAYVHAECVEHWLQLSYRRRCELCHYAFHVEVRPRYKMMESVPHWLLHGGHRRFLLCDLVSFIIFTPLLFGVIWLAIRGITTLPSGPGHPPSGMVAVYGVIALLGTLMAAYLLWLVSIVHSHVEQWRIWWEMNVEIRLVVKDPGPRRRILSTDTTSSDY